MNAFHWQAELCPACTIAVPRIGPVQEKETSTKVSAIKNGPKTPPAPALLFIAVDQLLGNVISNKPKKLKANTKKTKKKMVFSTMPLLSL